MRDDFDEGFAERERIRLEGIQDKMMSEPLPELEKNAEDALKTLRIVMLGHGGRNAQSRVAAAKEFLAMFEIVCERRDAEARAKGLPGAGLNPGDVAEGKSAPRLYERWKLERELEFRQMKRSRLS